VRKLSQPVIRSFVPDQSAKCSQPFRARNGCFLYSMSSASLGQYQSYFASQSAISVLDIGPDFASFRTHTTASIAFRWFLATTCMRCSAGCAFEPYVRVGKSLQNRDVVYDFALGKTINHRIFRCLHLLIKNFHSGVPNKCYSMSRYTNKSRDIFDI
jgi:hypothetical protein